MSKELVARRDISEWSKVSLTKEKISVILMEELVRQLPRLWEERDIMAHKRREATEVYSLYGISNIEIREFDTWADAIRNLNYDIAQVDIEIQQAKEARDRFNIENFRFGDWIVAQAMFEFHQEKKRIK